MRALSVLLAATLVFSLTCMWSGAGLAAPAAKPGGKADDPNAGPPKEPTTKSKGDETAAEKIDKQLNAVSERLSDLMSEEMNLTMDIMKMQTRANELVESPNKATEELSKGAGNPKLREYKQILLVCAQKLQGADAKYLALLKIMKAMERDREHAAAEQQARIDETINRIQLRHKANLEKIASFFEKVADPKTALQLYAEIYQSLPENKRDKTLKEKIATLSEKCGSIKDAIAMYKSILEAIPEKERYRDRGMGEKLGGLYEKAGDLRAALSVYKAFLDAVPPDKKDTDGKNLKEKIANIEKKLGKTDTTRQPPKKGK
jgi:tetratricopeptide (TPR) repeat protein